MFHGKQVAIPEKVSAPHRTHSSVERFADRLTGWTIYGMIVFSPWAFGTTQPWAIEAMNWDGYLLGALLLFKWIARGIKQNKTSNRDHLVANLSPNAVSPREKIFPVCLAMATVGILLYCLIAAANARANFSYFSASFSYHDYIPWLPHSYDASRSWDIFWNYLALAFSFWAVRDWLQNEDFFVAGSGNPLFSRRWKKLLWVVCLNGALLAIEGLVQRADNTGKLLWLVEPRIHKSAESQFGPYAYRSNGAQFLNLIWPVALGFWWYLQRASERSEQRQTGHHLLLPAALIMAAAAIVSLSRGGILGAVGQILVSLLILLFSTRRGGWKIKFGLISIGVATVALAAYVNWGDLTKRFQTIATDQLSGRVRLYQIAGRIFRDHALFGTGPNTFDPVSMLYLETPDAIWTVQAHNDWLETLATFGIVGSLLIWLALGLALARPLLVTTGIPQRPIFLAFLWVSLGGCLVHGAFDFPFQIYSILFLFLVLCALLSVISIRKN